MTERTGKITATFNKETGKMKLSIKDLHFSLVPVVCGQMLKDATQDKYLVASDDPKQVEHLRKQAVAIILKELGLDPSALDKKIIWNDKREIEPTENTYYMCIDEEKPSVVITDAVWDPNSKTFCKKSLEEPGAYDSYPSLTHWLPFPALPKKENQDA